jgi:hypothetical protein
MPLAVTQQAICIVISSALATRNDLRLGVGANHRGGRQTLAC